MSDEIKENILSKSQWVRILSMALFAVVCWVLGMVLTVVILGQVLFSLITGRDNDNLRQLGGSLGIYFYQILGFLTYNTDEKPFPFSAFPGTDDTEIDVEYEQEAEFDYEYQGKQAGADDGSADDVFADISFTTSKDSAAKESPANADDSEESSDADDIADEDIPTVSNDDDASEEEKPEGRP